jgi:DNA-binding NarL/FixJ family response regulator
MPTLERRATELVAELAPQLERESDGRVPEPNDVGPVVALTVREREILDCLVDGLSNAEIGRTLSISANTAANHVRAILLKTGCANRTEAATWAVRKGVVSN